MSSQELEVSSAKRFIQYFKERRILDIDIHKALQKYQNSGKEVYFSSINALSKVPGVTIEKDRIKIKTFTQASGVKRLRTRRSRGSRRVISPVENATKNKNNHDNNDNIDNHNNNMKLEKLSNIFICNNNTIKKINRKRVKLIVTEISNSYCDNFNRYCYINDYGCFLCDTSFRNENDKFIHESQIEHILREKYRTDRKFFTLQKSNAQICFNTTEVKEEIILNHCQQMVHVELCNTSNENYKLKIIELVPNKNISIINYFMEEDFLLNSRQSVSLSILITYSKPMVFLYPILVVLQSEHDDNFDFTLKDLIFRLQSPQTDGIIPTASYKYVEDVNLNDDEKPIMFEAPNLIVTENGLTPKRGLDRYDMPINLFKLLNVGLRNVNEMTPQMKATLTRVQNILPRKKGLRPGDSLTEKNYYKLLKLLLYIEEHQLIKEISNYNQIGKCLGRVSGKNDVLELEVGNLLEQRPSVMANDRVIIREEIHPDLQYEGTINRVHLSKLWISFGQNFLDVFNENTKYTVVFEMSRASTRKEHRAVELVNKYNVIKFLFPTKEMIKAPRELPQLTFFNEAIERNPEQKKAVMNIVAGSSYPAPYLLFGPPGTGKTVTLVEAIKQICKIRKDSHILVCTPSNSSANVITERLVDDEHFKVPLIRVLAASQDWDQIPDSIKQYVNYNRETNDFYYPTMKVLKEYRIIILTLITASRLVDAIFPMNHFTHLIIDECGQSTETEALVPMGNLISDKARNQLHGHIILAGDPKQLGPIIFSNLAKSYAFDISLLERLMGNISLYQRNPSTGEYDDRVLTKLLKNFRSHEALLQLSNEHFYEKELQACADKNLIATALGWKKLPNPKFPIIFHCSFGNEKQDQSSPSHYNVEELNLVEKYLKQIINCTLNPKSGKIISQSDVGVVTPYKKQVRKIEERCARLGYTDVEIGSVEQFQGREKLIIIVSTVRSQKDVNKSNASKILGFLKNEKRFNVALTRAQSLLIVIGNPNVLQYDKYWRSLIDYCVRNKAMKNHNQFRQVFDLGEDNDDSFANSMDWNDNDNYDY